MKYIKLTLLLMLISIGVSTHFMPRAFAQQTPTAAQQFKSIKVLNDMPADQMGKVMNMISASLGVDCKFCHASNDGDYDKEGFENKETARTMMRMVFDLNKSQFKGRPEINCNTCHNGRSHPQPSFPLGETKPAPPRTAQPSTSPTVDAILARYRQASSGAQSRIPASGVEIRSVRVEPDGKTSEPETIWLKGGRYAADLIYGQYRVREVFDGSISRKFGNAESIELKPDEAEQIKREAQFLSGADLKTIYSKLDYRQVDKINGRDAYLVIGTTPGGLRERLYFDVDTAVLVRRTATTPTVFGGFVYQVDHSDHKDIGGLRLPAITHYSVPHMSWTRRILEVKRGVAVADAVFQKPGATR